MRARGLMVMLVLMCCPVAVTWAQVAGPDAMMKGIEFTRTGSEHSYISSHAYQMLEDLAKTGANWVTVVPVWWMSDTGSSTVFWMPDQSPLDTEVRQAVRWARDLGLKVFMKPEVHCASGAESRLHDPHDKAWFYSYSSFIRHYAELAQQESCRMFCVGTELDSSTGEAWERDQWAAIIEYVKGQFLGPVTYAADWRTYRNIPFWDSLDLVGINAYFAPWVPDHHHPPDELDVRNLSEEWKTSYIPEIEAFRDSLGWSDSTKPLIFTEIGYRSVHGAATEPWNEQLSGYFDPTEQRNCYIAALHSLLGKPWFAGWFWHEWTTDPNQGGVGDLSYSPRGKPAQEVLRRWNSAIGTQRSMSAMPPPNNSFAYGDPSAQRAFQQMADIGAEWIVILPQGWMADTGENYRSIAIYDDSTWYPASPSDEALEQAIDWARELDFHVMVKPHVDCENNVFRGFHDPASMTQGSFDQWYDDYTEFVIKYAQMAEADSCEMFCIGTELNETADDTIEIDRWKSEVIPAVREVFSGPITFAGLGEFLNNGTHFRLSHEIWQDLDFVGVDAYFNLFENYAYHPLEPWRDTWDEQTPHVADLTGENQFPPNQLAWGSHGNPGKWYHLLDSIRQIDDKCLIFPEIGYQAIDSAAYASAQPRTYAWVRQTSGTGHNLYSVDFPVNSYFGFAVGDSGTILRTADGGGSWDSLAGADAPMTSFRSVKFPVNTYTGFIAGYLHDSGGVVLKTTDQGYTWNRASIHWTPGQVPFLLSLGFAQDTTVGFSVGEAGSLLKTTNAGADWYPQVSLTSANLRSVTFPTPDTGYIVGDGGFFFRTTDCGASWDTLVLPTSLNLYSVCFEGPERGFVVGQRDILLKTTDAGTTWASESVQIRQGGHPTFLSVTVPKVRATGDSTIYIVGDDWNAIRKGEGWSLDGGYQHFTTYRRLNSICFPESLVGYAVGDSGTITKASYGGRFIIDFNEQKNCFEAAFQAFWGSRESLAPIPWFYGYHWWAWAPDSSPEYWQHEVWLDNMEIHQKPVEQMVENWYATRPIDPGPFGHHVRHYPTGSLDLVVPPGGRTNVPILLARLESRSWENGGNADSARFLEEYYGTGDSLISMDSTAWFGFTADTTVRFLSGEGRYRITVQYKDVPDKVSPPYPDFEQMDVIFDSTSAKGTGDPNEDRLTLGR